jgi:rhomboid protease GluP
VTPPPGPPRPLPPSQPRYLVLPAVKPRLTYGLLAINILIFVAQTLTGPDQWFFLGAKINEFIVAGQWWRLVTPMFLHVNWFHIAVNSYSLYIFGPQVEALLGYRRFLTVYLVAGVSGTVLSFVLSPNPSVGASGAIFGLVGAMLVYFYRHRQLFGEMGRRRLIDILVIAGINLFIGLTPGIDNWGHVGGLAGGAVLAWLLGPIYAVQPDPATAQPRVVDTSPLNGQRWLGVLAVLLALVAITLGSANAQR